MRTGAPDLDDVDDLVGADTGGLLHSVALAGAQVRAVAEAVHEGVLAPLEDLQPRSVVVVCGAYGTARRAAELVTTLLATRVDVPVVCTDGLPGWVGPLDVVLVCGDDAGEWVLSDATARALRRRAEVVVAAPVEGPLRDALGGNGINLSPRLPVDPRFGFAHYVAALAAVLVGLRRVRITDQVPPLDEVADALDVAAVAGHVSREVFHNQPKLLAARIADRSVVFTGDTPATTVLAHRAAEVFLAVAGSVCAAADLPDAVRASAEIWARGPAGAADSIFYDPDLDGPTANPGPRLVVATTEARRQTVRGRLGAVDDVEVIVGEDEAAQAQSADDVPDPVSHGAGGAASGLAPTPDAVGDLVSLMLLNLRIEMAAVYVRLTGVAPR